MTNQLFLINKIWSAREGGKECDVYKLKCLFKFRNDLLTSCLIEIAPIVLSKYVLPKRVRIVVYNFLKSYSEGVLLTLWNEF